MDHPKKNASDPRGETPSEINLFTTPNGSPEAQNSKMKNYPFIVVKLEHGQLLAINLDYVRELFPSGNGQKTLCRLTHPETSLEIQEPFEAVLSKIYMAKSGVK